MKYFMERYPAQFMGYMQKISKVHPEGNQDVEWLIEAIGKNARDIETELIDYMQQFPRLEDPMIELFQERKKLHDSIVYFGGVK